MHVSMLYAIHIWLKHTTIKDSWYHPIVPCMGLVFLPVLDGKNRLRSTEGRQAPREALGDRVETVNTVGECAAYTVDVCADTVYQLTRHNFSPS